MQAQPPDDGMVDGGGAAIKAADVVARPQRPEQGKLAHQFQNRGLSVPSPADFLKAAMNPSCQ